MSVTGGIESLDEQIATVLERRERALDLLVRSLVEIDTLTNRVDVLLERKTAAKKAAT